MNTTNQPFLDNPARTNSPEEGREPLPIYELVELLTAEWLARPHSPLSLRINEFLIDSLDDETISNVFRAAFYSGNGAKDVLTATLKLYCTLHGDAVEETLRPSVEDEEYDRQLDAGEI